MSLWNSLESVQRLTNWTALAAAVGGFVAGVSGVITVVASIRAGALSQAEQVKTDKRIAIAENALAVVREPRRLTPKQRESLVAELKKIGPHEISANAPNRDNESMDFTNDIRDAFSEAGWVLPEQNQIIIQGYGLTGQWLAIRSIEDAPTFAGDVQAAFAAAGIPMDAGHFDNIPPGTMQILIGRKRTEVNASENTAVPPK